MHKTGDSGTCSHDNTGGRELRISQLTIEKNTFSIRFVYPVKSQGAEIVGTSFKWHGYVGMTCEKIWGILHTNSRKCSFLKDAHGAITDVDITATAYAWVTFNVDRH